VLRSHDRYGHRIDVVEYHPAYHELMSVAVGDGLHAGPWADGRTGAHVARAAKVITWYQVDAGHICPISMTYSVVPALRHNERLAGEWLPRVFSRRYDPDDRPSVEKAGVICGMAMTEKQGGSDVRANTTVARPAGLSCFWVPRWTPGGERNHVFVQRLKDKLGDRSNASAEIELADTYGVMVGKRVAASVRSSRW
jgi:putative acyl-CoA dehydrogenase